MWYALVIPLIITVIGYYFWKHKITVGEIFVPTGASFVFIFTSYFIVKSINLHDVEYNGHLIKSARYYEYWETWVSQMCTETYPCGTDANGHTTYCTRLYDCSYCDENRAYWQAYTVDGLSFYISEDYYKKLVRQWNAKPIFVDMNRNIRKHGSNCGQDGDAYQINWDGQIETSESAVTEYVFENKLKQSHSAFKFEKIEDEVADSMGLYRYPYFYDFYKQKCILSRDFKFSEKEHKKMEYLNASMGPTNFVKVFTLIFKNKPIDIAFKQEQYWEGGNQNELVVCIGVDDYKNIQWVKPFSWCDNKRIIVDTREDVANIKKLNIDLLYDIYVKNIKDFFHYKSFEDFNYLKFEPTTGQLWFVYIGTLLFSIGALIFIVKNDVDNE